MICRQSVITLLFAGSLAMCLSNLAIAASLECPASWPVHSPNHLVKPDLRLPDGRTVPASLREADVIDRYPDAEYDLACRYQDGREVHARVPGKARNCRVWVHFHPNQSDGDFITTKVSCQYQKTGDKQKDAVQFQEFEAISRQTTLFGVKLGTTAEDVRSAWKAAGYSLNNEQDKAVTDDGYSLSAQFTESDHRLKQLTITPPAKNATEPQQWLYDHFGQADHVHGYVAPNDHRSCFFWHERDGVRLEYDELDLNSRVISEIRLIDAQSGDGR